MHLLRRVRLFVLMALLLLPGLVQAQSQQYVVQPGDTIQRIAEIYNVTPQAILVANNLINPNAIRSGQVLAIPLGPVFAPATYTVRPGDRLNDIAARYNTTVQAIIAANGFIDPNIIRAGQVLNLPPMGGPVVQQAPVQQTAPQQTTTQQQTPQQVSPPAQVAGTYTVRRGETLRDIATRYGTTWQVLAAFNNIPNPNYIQAGQIIRIPGTVVQPPVQPPPPSTFNYIVRVGDTLSAIALRYNTTVATIQRLNGLPTSTIYVGQVLRIPGTGVVQPPVPPPVQPPVIVNGRYIVRPGDTLFGIARYFGVSAWAIAQSNGILNLNRIYSGQRLIIPGR